MTSTVIPTSASAPAPEGAPFIIERVPFNKGVQIEFANISIDEGKVYDWPMVYILANQSEAYVGQTTCVIQRMGQHGANPEKSQFTSCNIIYNDEFNHSVMDDYEHRLIELMNADGRFKLTNKNDGLTDYNYFGLNLHSKCNASQRTAAHGPR